MFCRLKIIFGCCVKVRSHGFQDQTKNWGKRFLSLFVDVVPTELYGLFDEANMEA